MNSLFSHKFFAAVSALLVIGLTSSCHDEEVTNIEEISYRHGYESNFIKTYGEISPDQTWDFSSYARRNKKIVLTRAATVNDFGIQFDSEGYFRVPEKVHDWVFDNVMEENGMANNKERIKESLWHAFSFEADNTEAFDLLPFYLGASQSSYTFHMVVVDPETKQVVSDTELWDLTEDTHMQWQSNGGSGWHDISGSTGSGGHGSTMQARTTRSKPILIDFSDPKYRLTKDDVKYTVYFTINVVVGHPQINTAGDVLTSITHTPNVVAVNMPANIASYTNGQGYEGMLFGCETGSPDKIQRTDYDFNDLMFLLVGRIPDVYYDEMLQTTTIKKRYMIEDLTGFDFDFNDIVVDLTDISVHHYIIDEENGIKEESPIEYNGVYYPTVTQNASFVYCCGTLPFQVKIGTKEFNRVTDPTDQGNTYLQLSGSTDADNTKVTILGTKTGIEPNYVYSYDYQYSETSPTPSPFWDPDANNISATIWTERDLNGASDSSDGLDGPWAWVSKFPDTGDVPFIIATDQSVNWSKELTHVDFNWLGGDMSTDNSYTVTVVPITTTTTNP